MKKDVKLLNQVKPELEEKLKARGWTDEQFETLWSDMLGFAKYSFNKCVSGDTQLLRPDGSFTPPVRELYATKKYGKGVSLGRDMQFHTNNIVDVRFAGIKLTYRLNTAAGGWVVCTANHKFPTTRGEKRLDELQTGPYGDYLYLLSPFGKLYVTQIDTIHIADVEPVFDVEMADPNHNFVTKSGLVVSNSHAAAYAILAYITAKQKAYYPAEFFAGLCNSYIGESSFVKDTVGEIMDDVTKHRIRLAPLSFRNDHRKCSVEDGHIVYAIPLIRDCNEQLAEALYSQSQRVHTHFWRLLKDLYAAGAKKSQVSILIKLDFFSEYGNAKELLRIYDIFEYFKQGEAKVVKKDKLAGNEFMYTTVAKYSKDKNDKGEELKSFKILYIETILDEVEDKIKTLELPDFDYRNKMADQLQYLGFINLVTGREEDRPKLHVRSVKPLLRKKDKKQFGYSIVAKSLGSGIETRYTVMNAVYNREPIKPEDIIYCQQYEREGQYFKLQSYRKIF